MHTIKPCWVVGFFYNKEWSKSGLSYETGFVLAKQSYGGQET